MILSALCLANELRRIAANLAVVEHVHHPQLLDHRVAELAERQMDPFFAVALR